MKQIDTGELRSIAEENFNQIPGTRSDTLQAFISKVFMWLAGWCGVKPSRESSSTGYCVFVLNPEVWGGNSPSGAKKMALFKEDRANPHLGGHLYITDYAMNKVLRFRGTCKNLNDVVCMLESNGLDDRPFIAFDTDTQIVYFCEDGSTEVTWQYPLRDDLPSPFSIHVFVEILDDIYNLYLKYPNNFPPIWYNSKDRVPCKNTETVIQGHVVCILRAIAERSRPSTPKTKWLTIYEHENNAGRIDISVFMRNTCIVASELKVLRHCRFPDYKKRKKRLVAAQNEEQVDDAMVPIPVSSVFNDNWALRGARQAARYKVAVNAKGAALVLYDMREEDEDIPAAKAQCARDDVRYLRYYLHNELSD